MLLIILFPVADSRAFLDIDTGVLNRPLWPDPIADKDFVRTVGAVRQRWRGGIPGWIGENKVCEAHQAIHFDGLRPYFDLESGLRVPFRLAYRRFYFDGLAVGKFEVGLFTPGLWKTSEVGISNTQITNLFYHFLSGGFNLAIHFC